MINFYGSSLVIDNDLNFLEDLKGEQKLLEAYPCFFSKSFREATIILKQSKHNVRIIFVASSISDSKGVEELKEIKKDHPDIPVCLISHKPDRDPKELFETDHGFVRILKKPKHYSDLIAVIEELFKPKDSWVGIEATKEEKDVELSLSDESYVPTLLADFIFTPKSFFNVFVRLGPSKFIKVLNSGDALQKDLIDNYAKKGVTHLYIPIAEHNKYLRFCDETSKRIVSREDISNAKKASSVLNLGANIAQSLMRSGISQEKLDFASDFLNQSVFLIKSMKMKNESLKRFIDTIETKEHTSTVSFLAGMIANEVGIESLKSVKLVGTAALLHDIGLYDLDPDFKEEELENLSEEKKIIFDKHQKHGGDLLRKAGGFDEVICQAVETHHMRRRGSDQSKRTNNINILTEVIGAADEIFNLVITKQLSETKLHYYTVTNLKNFSPQVERAVLKLLEKKKAT
jgi:putative nucleotidyltransferase with HDIG domain